MREPVPDFVVSSEEQAAIDIDRALVEKGGFIAFVRLAWHLMDSVEFCEEEVHRCLATHMEAVEDGRISHLLVSIPPSTGKTSLSILYAAWLWTKDPTIQIGRFSYSEAVVLRSALLCRELVKSQWYQKRWPCPIVAGADNLAFYRNAHKGEMVATTLASSILGRHFTHIILDDPNNSKGLSTGDGSAEANKINDVFFGTLPSRFKNPSDPRMIVIQQRISEKDLTSEILSRQGDKWAHLNLPMHYDPDRHFKTPVGDDWRTTPGELLMPLRYPATAIEDLRAATTPRDFAARYEQRPAPEGGLLFQRDWFNQRYHPSKLPSGSRYMSIDASFKGGKDADHVAITVWGVKGSNFYLVDLVRKQLSFVKTVEEIHSLMNKHGSMNKTFIEEAANGPAIISALKEIHNITGVVGVRAEGSKYSRAEAVTGLWEAGNVWLPEMSPQTRWVSQLVEEHCNFPNAKYDDIVDSCTMFLLYMKKSGVLRQAQMLRRVTKAFNTLF